MLGSSKLSETFQSIKERWMPIRLSTASEIHSGIGQCIVSFQSLEYSMKTFIQVLLDLNQTQADIVTSELSFRSLTCMFRALARQKEIPDYAHLDCILKSVEDAGRIRNGLVHGNWITQTRIKGGIKSRKGFTSTAETFSGDDLKGINAFIENLASAIYTIMFTYLRYCKTEGTHPKCAIIKC